MTINADDVAGIIKNHADAKPRNQQKAIGPSGLGTPCQRRLGYQLLDVEPVNDADPLAAWIGTAAHKAMEDALDGVDDWETELPVELPAYGIRGTADAYSRRRRVVVDWKFVAPTSLRKVKAEGPGEQYRVQAHTYGVALDMAGRPVDTVAVAFVPRTGAGLGGIHVWSEALDMSVVDAALARLEGVQAAVDIGGRRALPILHTADAYCQWCPYFLPAVTEIGDACPGHIDQPRTGDGTQPDTTRKDPT